MATNDQYDLWEHPLAPYAAGWCRLIARAMEHKKTEFQDDADDIMVFFNGTRSDFFSSTYAQGAQGYAKNDGEVPQPDFQMILMKVAEALQLFGPSLYSTDPVIEVNPTKQPIMPPEAFGITPQMMQPPPQPPVPQGQEPPPPPPPHPAVQQYQAYLESMGTRTNVKKAACAVLGAILNYSQREYDSKTHARKAVDEAMLSGLGVRWTEVHTPPGSSYKAVCSTYDSVKRLALDPDACNEDEIMWIARQRIAPYQDVEDRFELERDTLKDYAQMESGFSQEMSYQKAHKADGRSNDLMCYWDLYSKMGIGDKIPEVKKNISIKLPDLGKYCYLAVADKVPFFLNASSDFLAKNDEQEVFKRLQWPVPFWADGRTNGWPFTGLSFHKIPGHIWPMSHFKPGMGELKWLTWAMSFLANKVRTSCGTIIGVVKAAGEDLKKALEANQDNKIVELEQLTGKNINELVSFLQQPPFHGDIWKVVEAVFDLWDKRIGLSELMYGMSDTQDRSATETTVKQTNATARVSDMRAQVEDWATMIARKEAIALRWLMGPEDVQGILGPEATQVYTEQVMTTDLENLVREYQFSIVAGSTRLQDRQVKINNLNAFLGSFGSVLTNFAGQGIVQPINAIMKKWGELFDTDTDEWLVEIPPPQPPPPDPRIELEMQKMQAEIQKMQLDSQITMQQTQMEMQMREREMEMKQMEMEAKLQLEEAKANLELQIEERRAELEMQIERMKAEQEIQLEREKAMAQMQIEQQKAAQSADVERDKAAVQLETEEVKAATQIQTAQQKAETDQQVATQKAQTDSAIAKQKADSDIAVAKEKGKVDNEVAKERVKIEAKKAQQKPKPKSS